jgi:hypothetical protein
MSLLSALGMNMAMRERTLSGLVVLLLIAHALAGCSGNGSSPAPSPSPIGPPSSAGAGVDGVVYRRTPAGRTPLEGASVTLVVQVQTGPATGSTYPLYSIANGRGEFHFDSAPNGAKLIAYAAHAGTANPCMASVANYQGSASLEIDLYPDSESKEWIVSSVMAGPGPIVTGSARAGGVAASAGFTYFEAVYETFSANSPIDASGRYAFCGLPMNLMFPSRVWIENGRVSCDASGQSAFHAIQPRAPSEYFARDYDLYRCN